MLIVQHKAVLHEHTARLYCATINSANSKSAGSNTEALKYCNSILLKQCNIKQCKIKQ